MNVVKLQQPPLIVFGPGCAAQAADFLAQRSARRVLLVTSKSVRSQLAALIAAVRQTGADIIEAAPVPAEPTLAQFETMLAALAGTALDAVLAVGGGSVLDVGKLLAAFHGNPQKVSAAFGINLLSGRRLTLVCLPTTAGAGSEVSPNAILLDEAAALKKGVVSPHLLADAALVDPELTLAVPPAVTAATGLDALTHCIEAFANKFAHPIVDQYALQGIRLITAHLETAVKDGQNLAARSAVAMGSLYGGLCLGPVNTAAVHALAYPLGGRFRVAHGVANALLLPHVLRFNYSSAPERHAELAVALGVSADGSVMDRAERGVTHLFALSRACGVPQSLSQLNIPRDAIPELARSALQVTRLLKNNLRPLTESDAAQIYTAAY